MLGRLLRINERIAHLAGWVGGALMIFAACMVTLDVLLRKFLSVTLGGADEIPGYLFAIATVWAFSYAAYRVNVRIDALYTHFPRPLRASTGPTWSRAAHGLRAVAHMARDPALHRHGGELVAVDHSAANTACHPAVAVARGPPAVLVHPCADHDGQRRRKIRGDIAKMQRLIGVRTVSEEVEVEKAASTGGRLTPPDRTGEARTPPNSGDMH